MGSSQNQWERGGKLLASALDLVAQNARTPEEWADHLQRFVFDPRQADARGMRIYTCQIDKGDPALQPFNRDEFCCVESGLEPKHYPLKGNGIVERRFRVIDLWERFPEGHDPTTQELLDLVKAQGEDPDYADTKGFLRDNPSVATNEHPLISLCGSVVHRDGGRYVADFYAYSGKRRLCWDRLGAQWSRYCRLLVAC